MYGSRLRSAFLSSFYMSLRRSRNRSPSRLAVLTMYNFLQRVQDMEIEVGISCLAGTSDQKVAYVFVRHLNEINGCREKILPVSGSF